MRKDTVAAQMFGKTVLDFRTRNGLSQRDVAEVLGSYPAYVSNVEHGTRIVKFNRVAQWAVALGADPAYLEHEWLKADENIAPPIIRTRKKSIEQNELLKLIKKLDATERNRVLGYIHATLDNRPRYIYTQQTKES